MKATSGSTGSFVYDPAGRRATKVISGTQTNFLYDLANPVQELSGTTPTANLLTGGLDQYFTRTDANGTANFLTDALGGTAALTGGVGTVQTQYTVDPFGNTVQSGTSSTNSFAYTGRENDGTGLYYYRARYYNPAIGRFVTEDPIGFASGGLKAAYWFKVGFTFSADAPDSIPQFGNPNVRTGHACCLQIPQCLLNHFPCFFQSLLVTAAHV
jgi:RHS repeat-associated protein